MTRRTPIEIVLILGLGLVGCNSHSLVLPTAPTPPPLLAPTRPVQSVPQELWNLTGTYTGHTGPAECIPAFDGNAVQIPIKSVIAMQRSGGSIEVITEHDHYVGVVEGDVYLATDSDGGTWQCGAARFSFRTEGHVSGQFSVRLTLSLRRMSLPPIEVLKPAADLPHLRYCRRPSRAG